ncbi:MAG: hypothetical protein AB7W28_12335 [Armatimonadota bacterium]
MGSTLGAVAGQKTPADLGAQLGLCWELFRQASPEVRVAALKHLDLRYPHFTADILSLIAKYEPGFFTNLERGLSQLGNAEYTKATTFLDRQIAALVATKYPAVRTSVEKLLVEKYPDLLRELASFPEGPERRAKTRELLHTKYPELTADVLMMFHQHFSQVLSELQAALVARFPGLLLGFMTILQERYPQLTPVALVLVQQNAPGLVAEMVNILRSATPSGGSSSAPAPQCPKQ